MKKLFLLIGLVVFLTPNVYAYAYNGEWTLRETLNCPKQDDDIAKLIIKKNSVVVKDKVEGKIKKNNIYLLHGKYKGKFIDKKSLTIFSQKNNQFLHK